MSLSDQAGEIGRLYASGRTIREIAQVCGVSHTSIWRVMHRHGIATRCRGGELFGPDHPKWKGDGAGYGGFHDRVKRLRGTPQRCDRCGTTDPAKVYDWACLDDDYTDPWNFSRMCRTCHKLYDNARHGDLSVPEVAKRLRVTRIWVGMLIRDGKLEARKVNLATRSFYRVTEQALADYLQRRAS